MYGPKNIGFLFVAVEDCQKGEVSLTVLYWMSQAWAAALLLIRTILVHSARIT
jgi:hypothetical protein